MSMNKYEMKIQNKERETRSRLDGGCFATVLVSLHYCDDVSKFRQKIERNVILKTVKCEVAQVRNALL